jgi:hypothetical protein
MTISKFIEYLGSSLIFLGAIINSISIDPSFTLWAFVSFIIGHLIWSYISIVEKRWSLFLINGGFIPLDAYAIMLRIYPDLTIGKLINILL